MVFPRGAGVNCRRMLGMQGIRRAVFGVAAGVGLGGVAERQLLAAPHYRGLVSAHFDGRRFHNVHPAWDKQGSFLLWQLTRERGYWPDWIDALPGPPPPPRIGAGGMRITFINHATLLVQMDEVNILTDPIWSDRCSPFAGVGPRRHRPPGIRFRDLPKIDVVLLSHNHYDHLDLPTLHALRRIHQPRFITPLGSDLLLGRHGIRNVTALDWWDTTGMFTLVPSQHFCARGLSDRDANLWGGFVISGLGGNAYFAGDSGWGDHFTEIGRRCAPIRAAMLPIGAYLPRWFMQPVHINPEEAVRAHYAVGAQTSIAMHYGTFNLGDDGQSQPVEDLQQAIAAADNPRFITLVHGEGKDIA
jgi:L-ascorbate metabolism protein UlaG (beta-lactamase superfamily)